MKSKLILVLSLFLSTGLLAKDVDLQKSSFKWLGTKVTGKHVGIIKIKNASLKMKDSKLMSAKIVMDHNSISVTDLEGEWKQKFEGHIKSGDFFDVQKYPTSTLEVNKVDSKNLYGNLTIKGKTHAVVVPYSKKGNTYIGKLKFDRTKFNMVYGSGSFFKNLGDKMINDEVEVDFTVVTK